MNRRCTRLHPVRMQSKAATTARSKTVPIASADSFREVKVVPPRPQCSTRTGRSHGLRMYHVAAGPQACRMSTVPIWPRRIAGRNIFAINCLATRLQV
jgi:hypothetical protein